MCFGGACTPASRRFLEHTHDQWVFFGYLKDKTEKVWGVARTVHLQSAQVCISALTVYLYRYSLRGVAVLNRAHARMCVKVVAFAVQLIGQ